MYETSPRQDRCQWWSFYKSSRPLTFISATLLARMSRRGEGRRISFIADKRSSTPNHCTLSLVVPSPTLGCVSRLTDDVCGFPPGVMELCNHSQTTWQPPQEVWPPLHFCLAVYLLLSAVELIEQGLVVQPRQHGPRGLVWLFAKPCHSSLSAHSAILFCPEARKLAGQEINRLYIILTCWYHLHQKT